MFQSPTVMNGSCSLTLVSVWLCLSDVLSITAAAAQQHYFPVSLLLGPDVGLAEHLAADVFRHKQAQSPNSIQLQVNVRRISGSGAHSLHRTVDEVCEQLKSGAMGVITGGDWSQMSALDGLAKHLHMPTLSWSAPSAMADRPDVSLSDFLSSVKPSTHKVVAEWIHRHGWKRVVFMQDGPEAARQLSLIYDHLSSLHGVRRFQSDTIVEGEVVLLPGDDSRFVDFISDFHRQRYNSSKNEFRIVVHLSSRRRQRKFLAALENVSIQSPQRFYYVLADLGVTPRDIVSMRQRFLNITAFQLVNRETNLFREFQHRFYDIQRQNHPQRRSQSSYDQPESHLAMLDSELYEEITTEACLVYDSLMALADALQWYSADPDIDLHHSIFNGTHFVNGGYPGIYCVPSQDVANPRRPFIPFIHGAAIASYLRKTQLSSALTLTGPLQLDERGLRTNYSVHVYDMTYADGSSWATEQTYTWHERKGFVQHKSQAVSYNKTESKTLTVTTLLVTPFAFYAKNSSRELIGYIVDLSRMISKILGVELRMNVVKDGRYGNVDSRGIWDGMIGEVIRREADMAMAPLVINRQRERVVDFSKPFITTGLSIMIKKPDKQDLSVFSFMKPLSKQVWIYIILSYIAVTIVITITTRLAPSEYVVRSCHRPALCRHNPFTLYHTAFFALAAATQQSCDIHPRSIAGRIVSGTWWFFCLILLASYTANLAAFLTSEKVSKPINSVETLFDSGIRYGMLANGSTEQYFKTSTVPLYQKMYRRMDAQRVRVLVASYADGITKVRESKGNYAFLMEATANEYEATQLPCDTIKTGELLNSVGYGIATPIGSPYRQRISLAILMLQEEGELKRLENKWWQDRSQCDHSAVDNLTVSLNLSKVAGIFYLLMGSMVFAMFVTVCEVLFELTINQVNEASPRHKLSQTVRMRMPGTTSTLTLSAVAAHLLPAKLPAASDDDEPKHLSVTVEDEDECPVKQQAIMARVRSIERFQPPGVQPEVSNFCDADEDQEKCAEPMSNTRF